MADELSKSSSLLTLLPDFGVGGAQRVALTISNELARSGRNVHLVVLASGGPFRSIVSDSVHVHELAAARFLSAIPSLLKLIHQIKPKVVFSTIGYVNLGLLALKPIMPEGVKIWIREANLPSISLKQNRRHRLMQIGYFLLYPRADLVICSSERMSKEFAQDFALAAMKIRVLQNPVDEAKIRGSTAQNDYLPENFVRFVAAGRLTRQKGFDRLLVMFSRLADKNTVLHILGDGPLKKDLERQAKQLGLNERVFFAGFQPTPWSFYKNADAFLLPSRWEGMPNVVLEALACGVPIIATPESGGITEVADLANPGAVKVVEAGEPFIEAMRSVTRRGTAENRPSLLPAQHRLVSVVGKFESWITEIERP